MNIYEATPAQLAELEALNHGPDRDRPAPLDFATPVLSCGHKVTAYAAVVRAGIDLYCVICDHIYPQVQAEQSDEDAARDQLATASAVLEAALDTVSDRLEAMRDATRAWIAAEADADKARETVGRLALAQLRSRG
jgi:hypothetical protein